MKCSLRERGQISFHIEPREIFHNVRQNIISRFAIAKHFTLLPGNNFDKSNAKALMTDDFLRYHKCFLISLLKPAFADITIKPRARYLCVLLVFYLLLSDVGSHKGQNRIFSENSACNSVGILLSHVLTAEIGIDNGCLFSYKTGVDHTVKACR